MSADNTIYLKPIGDKFYIMEGSASCDYTNTDFLKRGTAIDGRDQAILAAHELSIKEQTEYGITEIEADKEGNQMQITFNDPHTGEPRTLTTEDHADGTTDVLVKTDDGTVAQSLHLPTETWREIKADR